MSTETKVLPFVTVVKIGRPLKPKPDFYFTHQEKKALEEYKPKEMHPYDLARMRLTKPEFVQHILVQEKLLTKHHGHDWMFDRPATTKIKYAAANEVLARLNLALIPTGKF